ncbi:MAG: FprA family A-type flavoprotein [Promethearchaeota archaeon]
MSGIKIHENIYLVGVNDRTTDLFEGLWPIPDGVSLNSFLIIDEKKVIIDLIKSHQSNEFISRIEEYINPAELDYIILNHLEPDHTGILNTIARIAPKAQIICTKRAKPLVEAYYHIKDNIKVVEDGETLSLGKFTLQFFDIPMVHWPETMATYETNTKILFSCDAFGGFSALRGAIFDDEVIEMDYYIKEALRYYANIIAKYSPQVLRAIDKLAALEIKMVAPSHGVIWRKEPNKIIELYKKWAEYGQGKDELGVTIIYGSMYGNTEILMNAVARGIAKTGIPIEIVDAARIHPSFILPSVWKYRGVIVGAPTYELKMFPPAVHVLDLINRKQMKNKVVTRFGSYGWSGGAQKEFEKIIEELNWEQIDYFEFRGGPTKEDLEKAEQYGEEFAKKLKKRF